MAPRIHRQADAPGARRAPSPTRGASRRTWMGFLWGIVESQGWPGASAQPERARHPRWLRDPRARQGFPFARIANGMNRPVLGPPGEHGGVGPRPQRRTDTRRVAKRQGWFDKLTTAPQPAWARTPPPDHRKILVGATAPANTQQAGHLQVPVTNRPEYGTPHVRRRRPRAAGIRHRVARAA